MFWHGSVAFRRCGLALMRLRSSAVTLFECENPLDRPIASNRTYRRMLELSPAGRAGSDFLAIGTELVVPGRLGARN